MSPATIVQAILCSPFGCGTISGYANMAAYCRASCGAYCAAHGCKSKSGKTDYATHYCVASGSTGSCFDTTAVDYACPHHSLGKHVPSTCNDARSANDDACARTFTGYWKRCRATLTSHVSHALVAELAAFNRKCAGTSSSPGMCGAFSPWIVIVTCQRCIC